MIEPTKADRAIARKVTYKVMAAERNAKGVRHDASDEAAYLRDFTQLVLQARQLGVPSLMIPRWIIASYFPASPQFVTYAMTF